MKRDERQVLTEWLVLDVQRGSEASLRELVELWTPDLRRLAHSRVERWDAANEVVCDAWLDIARGLPSLNDPACFPRWAMSIVWRRGADWVRRQSRDRRRQQQLEAETGDWMAASAVPARSDAGDELDELRRGIRQLATEQQELLHLHYTLERSVREIAEILGIPPGTVKSRLFSAREALKPYLRKETT